MCGVTNPVFRCKLLNTGFLVEKFDRTQTIHTDLAVMNGLGIPEYEWCKESLLLSLKKKIFLVFEFVLLFQSLMSLHFL